MLNKRFEIDARGAMLLGPGACVPGALCAEDALAMVGGILTSMVWMVVLGFGCGLSTVLRAGQLATDALEEVRASRVLGPVMKALLPLLLVGATPLLPLVAILAASAWGARFGFERGLQDPTAWLAVWDELEAFHANALPRARRAVAETLSDPARLGLPF